MAWVDETVPRCSCIHIPLLGKEDKSTPSRSMVNYQLKNKMTPKPMKKIHNKSLSLPGLLEQGKPCLSLCKFSRKLDMCTKGNVTAHSLHTGRAGWLYSSRAGTLHSAENSPWCKYSDLSGRLMEQRDQSPVLEQSLARTQDAPKKSQAES